MFSVVEASTDELVGETLLWAIDMHHRTAHIGIALRPRFRGQGLSGDVLQVLCRYAFDILGLHRLQIETLSENTAILRAARRIGFSHEGVRRQAHWADGAFRDETVLGLLRSEFAEAPDLAPGVPGGHGPCVP